MNTTFLRSLLLGCCVTCAAFAGELFSLTNEFPTAAVADSNGVVYAALTNGMIIRSSDCGRTWHLQSGGFDLEPVYALCLDTDGVLFAGSRSGVFMSTDRGVHWESIGPIELEVRTQVSIPWEPCPVDARFRSIDVEQDGRIIIANPHDAFLFSSDDGITWSRRGRGLVDSSSMGFGEPSLHWYPAGNLLIAKVRSQWDLTVYYTSRDSGKSFERCNDTMTKKLVRDCTFAIRRGPHRCNTMERPLSYVGRRRELVRSFAGAGTGQTCARSFKVVWRRWLDAC